MKNRLFRSYLAILIVGLCLLLFPGCSTGKTSYWDYYGPEHVNCSEAIKVCRSFGPRLICECVA